MSKVQMSCGCCSQIGKERWKTVQVRFWEGAGVEVLVVEQLLCGQMAGGARKLQREEQRPGGKAMDCVVFVSLSVDMGISLI